MPKFDAGHMTQYYCGDCLRRIVTITRDAGYIPMALSCLAVHDEKCYGVMRAPADPSPVHVAPTHEWYRPDGAKGLTLAELEDVRNGGLLLRKIGAEVRNA